MKESRFPLNTAFGLVLCVLTGCQKIDVVNSAPSSVSTIDLPAPIISSVSPAIAGSGFTITISGSNFQSSAAVRVDGAACTNVVSNATQITCKLPVDSDFDVVDVEVINPDNKNFTMSNSITRMGAPILWFDASRLALNNNDLVTQWEDLTDNGGSLTAETPGKRPVFKSPGIGGKPAIAFDQSVSQCLRLATDQSVKSLFIVLELSTPLTSYQGILGSRVVSSNPRSTGLGYSTDSELAAVEFSDGVTKIDHLWPLPIYWGTLNSVIISDTESKVRLDGAETIVVNAAGYSFTFGHVAGSTLADGSSSCSYTGKIAEIIAFTNTLTPAEVTEVEAYLQAKY